MADDYTPTADEMLDGYVTMRSREIPGDRVMASIQALSEAERWLAAHDAEKRAEWEAEQGEVEWEYGVEYEATNTESVFTATHSEEMARKWVAESPTDTGLRRRRKAGTWEPCEVTP